MCLAYCEKRDVLICWGGGGGGKSAAFVGAWKKSLRKGLIRSDT